MLQQKNILLKQNSLWFRRGPLPATILSATKRNSVIIFEGSLYLSEESLHLETKLNYQKFYKKTVVTAFFFPLLKPWSNPTWYFLCFVIFTFTCFFFVKRETSQSNGLQPFRHHEIYQNKIFDLKRGETNWISKKKESVHKFKKMLCSLKNIIEKSRRDGEYI